MIINPSSDITFLGTTIKVGEDTKFPPYPNNGDFSFLDGILHIYGTVDNVTTWYPISVQNQYYIHIQEVSDNVWDIVHNLDDTSLTVMAYNAEGILVECNRTYVDSNTLKLHFTENVQGKAIIYIPKDDSEVELDALFNDKANVDDVYTKLEVDMKDALKADVEQVYFQTVLDTRFNTKAAKGNTTIQLTGDVTGSGYVSNDGSNTLTMPTTVVPDSHTHDTRYYTESEMDTKLNTKLNATTFNAANILTKVKTVDGLGSGLDADLLRGYDIDTASTADTIPLRDSSGDIQVSTKVKFSNDDVLRYDDATNIIHLDVDGGTENGKFGNANLLDGHDSTYFLKKQSSNDFTQGTLITTDIDISMTNGPSINFEIIGKSYSTSQPPIRIEGQCYIYNNTIQNQSAITTNSNITSIYLLKDAAGMFCIWIPRITYWNSYVATVWVSSTGGFLEDRTTGYTDVVKPTSTKEVQITPYVLMHSGNYTPPSSTAFDWGHSFSTNGYQRFTDGLIIQWGRKYMNVHVYGWCNVGTITWPIAFPHALYSTVISYDFSAGEGYGMTLHTHGASTTSSGNILASDTGQDGARAGNIHFIAIGY